MGVWTTQGVGIERCQCDLPGLETGVWLLVLVLPWFLQDSEHSSLALWALFFQL